MPEISNYDEWDGFSYIEPWSGGASEYYGHRLLFSENTVIQKISFWIKPWKFAQEETVPYVAYLWEFDENTREEVNPPVWYSNLLYTDNFSDSNTVNEVITDLGGIEVEANKTYLFSLVSTDNIIDDNGIKMASTKNLYEWAIVDLQNSDSLPETRSLTFHNEDTDFTIGQHNPSAQHDYGFYAQWSNRFGGDFIIKIVTGSHEDAPVSTACFTGDAVVKTDQGLLPIKDITANHTIDKKMIKGVSKTTYSQNKLIAIAKHAFGKNMPNKKTLVAPFHRFLVDGCFKAAVELVNNDSVYVTNYKQETLYNVILETQETMKVNNLVAETLNPNTLVAKLFDGSMSKHQRAKVVKSLNSYHKNLKNKPNKSLKDYRV